VLQAQNTTGSFNGHVYDANGSVMADAKVALQDIQTGLTWNTTTNSEGLYGFPLIKPGTYQLTVTAAGFETVVKPNSPLTPTQPIENTDRVSDGSLWLSQPPQRGGPCLVLDVNQIAMQDFTLKIGAATQTVTVSASSQMLESSTADVGAVVDERTVGNLPLNGRSFSAC